MYNLYNIDNMIYNTNKKFDLIYADYIYENLDFSWISKHWDNLKANGIFIVQTDWHSNTEVDIKLKSMLGAKLVNKLVWKNEWGNHPKDRFHQCYDDIIIYTNGVHSFYSDKIQVPKVTINKGLNPSGRQTKTATAWIDDICLTTTSKERVKKDDGHLIRWQKPLALMQRICSPFLKDGDDVLDLFMGSGTLAEWCVRNNINYTGIEYDKNIFDLAQIRLNETGVL